MRYLNRFSHKSIRFKLVFGFLLLVIPLLALLIYNNYYAIEVVRGQVADSNTNLTTLYMNQIDQNLEEVDKYLQTTAALEINLPVLDLPEREYSDSYHLAKVRLFNKLGADINNYKSIDLLFIYSSVNDELISSQPPGETFSQQEMIRTGIVQLLQDKHTLKKHNTEKWFIHKVNDDYYLCDIARVGNVYIGGWVQSTKLMTSFNSLKLDRIGKSILITEKLKPMNDIDFIKENGINLRPDLDSYNFWGKTSEYLQVSKPSTQGNFALLVLIPYSSILGHLPNLRLVSSLILIGVLIILPLFYMFIRNVILLPISRIVAVMRRVRHGHLEDRIVKYPVSSEFELMNDVFNSMVSQINELKINVYEEQLLSQKAELKHLQMQINPHFFLNSLNMIYSLAQLKDFKLIQELSQCLTKYMRFMFQNSLKFVSLEDELAHTQNYLQIQVMRFYGRFTYHSNCQEALLKALIPPLIIQTFAENTIKHAITMDETIRLRIDIEHYGEDEKFLRIVISDTGTGFSEQTLQKLQTQEASGHESREHIGVWNARRRLGLLFQDQARLTLSNNSVGGAHVEIYLPLIFEE